MAVTYEVTVEIEARPELVWAVLADVERWPEWTASMRSVRRLDAGEQRVGSEACVAQPRLPEATWRVTELEPGSRFAWESRSPGLRSAGDHAVTRLDDRRSRALLALDQTGPAAPLVALLYGRLIRRYLALESAGLGRRCEEGGLSAP